MNQYFIFEMLFSTFTQYADVFEKYINNQIIYSSNGQEEISGMFFKHCSARSILADVYIFGYDTHHMDKKDYLYRNDKIRSSFQSLIGFNTTYGSEYEQGVRFVCFDIDIDYEDVIRRMEAPI